MNCIKKFSRIVCVSLFSYQGCFAVSSLRQLVYFIISSRSCQALFSKVFEIFQTVSKVVCFCRSVQATWLLYHKFSHLSTVNLNFLKTILFFSISEAIPCDSLFILPLPQVEVKHFLQKSLYFLCSFLFTHNIPDGILNLPYIDQLHSICFFHRISAHFRQDHRIKA